MNLLYRNVWLTHIPPPLVSGWGGMLINQSTRRSTEHSPQDQQHGPDRMQGYTTCMLACQGSYAHDRHIATVWVNVDDQNVVFPRK